MPIIRYFVLVGAVLLALLFAVDRYLPAPEARSDAEQLDKTVIRIHSARALPEKIVFDTRAPAGGPVVATTAGSAPGDIREEPTRAALAATAAKPSAPAGEAAPTHGRAEKRLRAKRPVRLARRPADRRLAFDRHDGFGGWW